VDLIKQAIEHPGFAVVEVMSPCVTFNKHNTYAWFKEHVFDVTQIEGYDNTDRNHAFEALTAEGKIPLGIIYRGERATLDDLVLGDMPPLVSSDVYDVARFHGIQDAYR
jgi:2-oxoglutarate ferredoxin oxidoreductase subunit beta